MQDLPDGDAVARLHDDLQRSKAYGEAAARDPSIRIRLDSFQAIDTALSAADALEKLRALHAITKEKPWLKALADRLVHRDRADCIVDLIEAFAADARPIVWERKRYVAAAIDLPDGFDDAGPDAAGVVAKLAAGGKVFGLLSFRERALRSVIEAILVQGRAPADPGDWTLVRDHLAWRSNVAALFVRWRTLSVEVDGTPIASARELADLMAGIDAVLIDASASLETLEKAFAAIVPGGATARSLWFDPARLAATEDALRNAAASAQLSAVRAELTRLSGLFSERSGKLGRVAYDFLSQVIGRDGIEPERIATIWTNIRSQIDVLRQHAEEFETVREVAAAIDKAGAPSWAGRLCSEPALNGSDPLMPTDWREAWDWAAATGYLKRIDNRERLRSLAEERVRFDAELHWTFERVVRERTFYELGRSMTGTVRGALMMFATALRRTGRGTGKGAARHRRDAQLAMSQCYGAIPCWIMPSWRVAEQLPGEVGSFDLVIMDEASQSDIRELPALLRGKKILVVGDDKQVSPTAAFIENAKIDRLEHNYLREQPYKTLLLPGSSLYDLAKVMFPDKFVMLREHFRCVEPIIRFSMSFYPEPLIPLRVPAAHERLDPPLVDIYVPDGRRTGDKQNRREAEVIVEEIQKIVDNPVLARIEASDRWRTIGVVSLIGAKQAALINHMLLDELGEDLIRRHHIACGDSATFQGNERDIIFLSMIADPSSKQAQTAAQFEQRFNVAMSRARDRLVLVRSVQEEELKPDDLKARVIRHFRDPMAGAAAPEGDLEAIFESDFERDVFRRLTERGFKVTPQVGALGYRIDLVVEGDSGRRLAVECDGDKHHGPERWADDMRRQRILERVGWRFWRCWASSFVLDPEGSMADLFATLDRLGIDPDNSARRANTYTLHFHAPRKSEAASSAEPVAVTPAPQALREIAHPTGTAKAPSPDAIRIGDRVVIQYLDDRKQLTVTLTKDRDDITNGYLPVTSPLGSQLLGASEDEEVEFNIGDRVRRVLILRADRPVQP